MLIIATHVRSGRLGFLASPKFAAVVGVAGVLVAVLAYVNDLQGRNQSDGGRATAEMTPAPTPDAGLASSTPSPSPNRSADSSDNNPDYHLDISEKTYADLDTGQTNTDGGRDYEIFGFSR